MTKLPPLHPGEVLREEFMEPLGLTPYTLAARLDIPRARIERIVREEKGVSADTALRLGAYFHTTPEFWMNLQSRFELEMVLRDRGVARQLHRIEEAAAA
jgi:addiction module HigA family antidote